jgi:hypothetical protein
MLIFHQRAFAESRPLAIASRFVFLFQDFLSLSGISAALDIFIYFLLFTLLFVVL